MRSCTFRFIILLVVHAVASAVNNNYAIKCDGAFCRILEEFSKQVGELKSTVDGGSVVTQLGSKADGICNSALEKFAQEAPLPDDDKQNEALYDKKVEELEKYLDSPLHVVYLKQLALIREKAMKNFKAELSTNEGSEYEALMQADEFFRREAEESTRQNPDWDYTKETQALKASLSEIAARARKIQDIKVQTSKQTSQAMQYLQIQAQQMQAIQQQMQMGGSPWNIGAAYRVPDSNINLSCSYQQGKGNVQISCVPDEAVSLLGPNGFVNGVTPGNIGLSFNINI